MSSPMNIREFSELHLAIVMKLKKYAKRKTYPNTPPLGSTLLTQFPLLIWNHHWTPRKFSNWRLNMCTTTLSKSMKPISTLLLKKIQQYQRCCFLVRKKDSH